jgi:RNA polymerase sigma factor (sigma-70 family)
VDGQGAAGIKPCRCRPILGQGRTKIFTVGIRHSLLEEIELPESGPSLTEQIHYDQMLNAYQQALMELPVSIQQVVKLYHVDGLTHREIARKLGKSTSWVEKSITKALLYCRQQLEDFDF